MKTGTGYITEDLFKKKQQQQKKRQQLRFVCYSNELSVIR